MLTGLDAPYKDVCDNKDVGCFRLLSNGFASLRLIVLKNQSQVFNFAVFCSFLSNF